jgi:dTDP-4-amino-4,6-dideoxygalactose transaminase
VREHPQYPLLRPNPAKLSNLSHALAVIEESGIYSNYGPVNQKLEENMIASLFGGKGHCVTVCNATSGLILAIRMVIDRNADLRSRRKRRFALMPAFTFAATAHAAIWNNLEPLFCDIEPDTWCASLTSLADLVKQFSDEIAVIVPYATFGNSPDLAEYLALASACEVPIVVDAAASLGSRDTGGRQFGSGSPYPVVYSMHVTKTFSTAEAGLVYCDDKQSIDDLRCMGNFGFGVPRRATMPGFNAKLSEVGALLALEKLQDFDRIVAHRAQLAEAYRQYLPKFAFQVAMGVRNAYQFMPALLPPDLGVSREEIVARLARAGVGVGTYFSPHLADQPYFKERSKFMDLSVTEAVSSRIISLPMYDTMAPSDVRAICDAVHDALAI